MLAALAALGVGAAGGFMNLEVAGISDAAMPMALAIGLLEVAGSEALAGKFQTWVFPSFFGWCWLWWSIHPLPSLFLPRHFVYICIWNGRLVSSCVWSCCGFGCGCCCVAGCWS